MAARVLSNMKAFGPGLGSLLRPMWFINQAPCFCFSSKTNFQTSDLFVEVSGESLRLKHKPRLEGRKYLPGSTEGAFPEFLASPTESFPYVIQAAKPSLLTIEHWAEECRVFIDENLFDKEAIIFRNLPVNNAAHFSEFSRALGYRLMSYRGGLAGNRNAVDENSKTYTASDDPPEFCIEPHNEMSYSSVFPNKLFFFCLTPPQEGCGGETPLVQNRKLLSRLNPEVVEKLEKKGIRYRRYAPNRGNGSYMSWQDCFGTDDPKEAEQFLEKHGYEYSWDKTGGIGYWYVMPSFRSHPISREKILFNQVNSHHSSFYKTTVAKNVPDHMCPGNTAYGDGSDLEPEVLRHIRAVSWSCAVGFPWQQGDFLVMDNLLTQHARLGFTGERKLLVAMTTD